MVYSFFKFKYFLQDTFIKSIEETEGCLCRTGLKQLYYELRQIEYLINSQRHSVVGWGAV